MSMQVLHLNTSDKSGGAARAAYRLNQGLRAMGQDSRMLVQSKKGGDFWVHAPVGNISKGLALLRPSLDALPARLFMPNNVYNFSAGWLGGGISKRITAMQSDIIHLHWINNGMMRLESIRTFKQPVVWTLHDMWVFTGGCHYDDNCIRYRQQCGFCPQLLYKSGHDISTWNWKRKANTWQKSHITYVTPSRWLADCAKQSTLLQDARVEVIANGVDLSQYKPVDRHVARNLWRLPQDKHIIVFGAMDADTDKRKGFDLLQKALQLIASQSSKHIELLVFGADQPKHLPMLGLPIRYAGRLQDEQSLVTLYSAADVMVAPSRQENLANTVVEALACGLPCVAFNIGGMPDMIDHLQNGYLARAFSEHDLAHGINWVLQHHQWLSQKARQKALACFDVKQSAQAYRELYRQLLHTT